MRTHAQANNIPHKGRTPAQPSSVHESDPLHMGYAEYGNTEMGRVQNVFCEGSGCTHLGEPPSHGPGVAARLGCSCTKECPAAKGFGPRLPASLRAPGRPCTWGPTYACEPCTPRCTSSDIDQSTCPTRPHKSLATSLIHSNVWCQQSGPLPWQALGVQLPGRRALCRSLAWQC